MGWWIKCDSRCAAEGAWAHQIEDLLRNHRRDDGRFVCSCGSTGRIEKEYALKGKGEDDLWRPHLIGAIQPKWLREDRCSPYQPFLFITRDSHSGELGVWCRYYKRLANGKLKFGDGPGGGPAFSFSDLAYFSDFLREAYTSDS